MNFKFKIVKGFAFVLLAVIGATSRPTEAANLTVNCDRKQTISETVKLLSVVHLPGSHTLSVVGSCHENIVIQSVDRLILIAKNGASITDRSGGSLAVVDIEDSHSVTLQGFTINGGSAGVSCGTSSVCYLTGDAVQDVLGVGVSVSGGSHVFLESNVIQNNAGAGAIAGDGSQMFSSNDVFQNNATQGVNLGAGAYFVASNSSFLNNGVGILSVASNLLLHGGTISGSIGNGMTLLGDSTATFRDGTTVTSNGGEGVHLEDASFAGFQSATVTGNSGGLDVDCAPQFTITHFVDRTGGVTNCKEPSSAAQRESKK
jgi:hypothetical protein